MRELSRELIFRECQLLNEKRIIESSLFYLLCVMTLRITGAQIFSNFLSISLIFWQISPIFHRFIRFPCCQAHLILLLSVLSRLSRFSGSNGFSRFPGLLGAFDFPGFIEFSGILLHFKGFLGVFTDFCRFLDAFKEDFPRYPRVSLLPGSSNSRFSGVLAFPDFPFFRIRQFFPILCDSSNFTLSRFFPSFSKIPFFRVRRFLPLSVLSQVSRIYLYSGFCVLPFSRISRIFSGSFFRFFQIFSDCAAFRDFHGFPIR